MKKFTLCLTVIATLGLGFTSCENNDEIVEDVLLPDDTPGTELPTTYTFKRNNETSISYTGQTQRLKMGAELLAAFKDTSKTEEQILDMFAHEAGNNDFSESSLNESGKNIRSKTAASVDYFGGIPFEMASSYFDDLIVSQVNEVFTTWEVPASEGVAGVIEGRHVNANGLEYDQAFNKGLMGAFVGDQIMNNYLSTNKLDAGTNRADNDAGTLKEGKNYTNMEHQWDEAFGYLYGLEEDAANPQLGVDKFLNKYLKKVDSDPAYTGIAKDVYNAFIKGRYAITVKDYTTRDEQANIIRELLSKVIAIKAIDYLDAGKDKISDGNRAGSFHDLSEGQGFIFSLMFTRDPDTSVPYFSKDEILSFLSQLEDPTINGFWGVSTNTLETISSTIADRFNL